MTVILIGRDLLFGSRIADAATRAGHVFIRLDDPARLPNPASVQLVLVDWAERGHGWGQTLTDWCARAPISERPRLLLFGPHTDLVAHADARAAGLGPMWARSKLVADLPTLMPATT